MANCQLHRIYLNNGGYDSAGTYWGHGQPLYRYIYDDGKSMKSGTLRASTRDSAKKSATEYLREVGLAAVFYR